MPDGYHGSAESDGSYSWLDEMLCEYVDGTMDPALRRAFEEYLRVDPQLAEQVERLRCTRSLLCRHGCQMRAPRGLESRVRRRLACEMMRAETSPALASAASRLATFASFVSIMAFMTMVGLCAGAYLFSDRPESLAGRKSSPLVKPDVTSQETRSGLHRAAMTPLTYPYRTGLSWDDRTAIPGARLRERSVRHLPEVLPLAGVAGAPAGLRKTDGAP